MANKVVKRASNFNATETEMLMHYVKKYQHKIECKKSNKSTNLQKKEVWSTIEKAFNSLNITQQYRSASVLRKKWENIKKSTKDKAAEEKKEFENTGGGPPQNIEFTPAEKETMQILGEQRVSGAKFQLDDDSAAIFDEYITVEEDQNDEYTIDDPEPVSISHSHPSTSSSNEIDQQGDFRKSTAPNRNPRICLKKLDKPITQSLWKKYTPETLRQPKTPCLTQNAGKYSGSTQQAGYSITNLIKLSETSASAIKSQIKENISPNLQSSRENESTPGSSTSIPLKTVSTPSPSKHYLHFSQHTSRIYLFKVKSV